MVTDVLAVTHCGVFQRALTAELQGPPAWKTLPSGAVVATEDHAIPGAAQEFMTERDRDWCRLLPTRPCPEAARCRGLNIAEGGAKTGI
jgi:hypothetical protein